MPKKNPFLAKQQDLQLACFDAGLQCGRQQILDMMSLVLRDPEIMGKDTFGKKRLLKVVNGIGEYIDKFQPAWEKKDDTDYYRAKMDANALIAEYDRVHIGPPGGARKLMEDAPTVDAVEVVRCKKCKYSTYAEGDVVLHCERCNICARPDHFCSYGERRSE